MRSIFPEYYRPTPDETKAFVTKGTVAIDANVLLGLYEMTATQRDEVLDVFESVGDRLWIPHRVALEYQRGRMAVIRKQASFYNRLVNLPGVKMVDDYEKALEGIQLPKEVTEEVKALLGPLRASLHAAAAQYVETVRRITERHIVTAKQAEQNDPVRIRLDAIFDGRVGAQPDDDELVARVNEGLRRIEASVPPGYKDEKKADDADKVGDYLLWAELLEHSKATASEGRPTLLVTNDTKDDWYETHHSTPLGPRLELVKEFAKHSPNGYHQVTLEGLLRLANQYLAAKVDRATIQKASEITRSDERSVSLLTEASEVLRAARAGGASDRAIAAALHELESRHPTSWAERRSRLNVDLLNRLRADGLIGDDPVTTASFKRWVEERNALPASAPGSYREPDGLFRMSWDVPGQDSDSEQLFRVLLDAEAHDDVESTDYETTAYETADHETTEES